MAWDRSRLQVPDGCEWSGRSMPLQASAANPMRRRRGPLPLTLTEQLTNAAAEAGRGEPGRLRAGPGVVAEQRVEPAGGGGPAGGGASAIQQAVQVYRRPAEANPAAYEPNLASSLNNLSVNLAEAGRREEQRE
jgi:hypothetical protein